MMLFRVLVVVGVVALGYVAVSVVERRRMRSPSRVPMGITLVSTSACQECVVAERKLVQAGAVFTKVDPAEAVDIGVHTFTVPTAVVGDASGNLVMVRRGKSVASDAALLARSSVPL